MSEDHDPKTPNPPPVDFRILIGSFVAQAMSCLGKVPNPMTGETKPDLPWARYFIDVLGMIADKTAGNLEPAEQADLDAQLSMLRLTYVDMTKAALASAEADSVTKEAPDADAPEASSETSSD
ncbi:MAG: hypothetical protein CMJ85_08650 [Planctomycetes bacterium]|nr:hypothetical protein [Planctomycetota bacterium]